jgi:tetratricopeptide (TPR) repeat protein
LAQGQLRESTTQLLEAALRLPPQAESIARLARMLCSVGEVNGARRCLEHPAVAACRVPGLVATLGLIRQMLGEHAAALRLLTRAGELGLETPELHYFRGLELQFLGHGDEALGEMQACLQRDPGFGRAALSLARGRRQVAGSDHLDAIDAGIGKVERGSVDHASFEFARYKELEDLGRDEEAWAALERGNAVMAARLPHDSVAERALFDAVIARCDARFIAPDASPRSAPPGPTPIFILGLPRTGTTLLERILTNHSQVTSAGELNDFWRQLRRLVDLHGNRVIDEEMLARLEGVDFAELGRRYLEQTQWRAEGRPYYVDKLPANSQVAGLIRRALPHAPMLHMVRDPMDACFSNFKAMFGDACAYSYRQDTLAAYFGQYRRLMRHWHEVMPGAIFDVSYSDLVQASGATARRVLEFCGLPFEPECLDLGRNRAPVSTLSTAQVREGIHTRSLGEWQRYARQLEPLRQALESAPV